MSVRSFDASKAKTNIFFLCAVATMGLVGCRIQVGEPTGNVVQLPTLVNVAETGSLFSWANGSGLLVDVQLAAYDTGTGAIDVGAEASGALLRSASSDNATIQSMQIPIFMYHYVEIVRDPKDTLRQRLAISPAAFEEQLRFLSDEGYRTLFVRNVPALLSGSLVVQKRVILTFDDGYEDFYTNVFPLLRKYGAKATLYMIADRIGTGDYMTEDQLREVARSGLVEIGSHTLDHPDLRTLSLEKQKEQIVKSKRILEKRLGISVRTFAYPIGGYTKDTVELVHDAGYIAAVTIDTGREQRSSILFTLKRIRPGVTTNASALRSLLGQ